GATKHIDRLEWMVEKLVEIGVDRISIIKSDQCERKSTRLDRLERIAVSAMKQSLKTVMPKVETDIPFKDFVASLKDTTSVKMIAHCSDDPTLPKKVTPYELYEGREDAVILIGPEGDFTKEEVEFAIANGFRTITLGEARLRTETAAVSALQWLQIGQKIKLSEENRQK
ncbi:MAG: RsmE family RNA methyltransferase, partial [Porphyromonadaceae bacterium]|nr:RsmE family RNA methyltransferase [Porphyromonadaceae bacterium]